MTGYEAWVNAGLVGLGQGTARQVLRGQGYMISFFRWNPRICPGLAREADVLSSHSSRSADTIVARGSGGIDEDRLFEPDDLGLKAIQRTLPVGILKAT